MCEPATIAYAAVMVAGALYTTSQQKKAAKRNERFYRASQEEQAKQIFSKRSAEANKRLRAARAERATLRAMSGESGLKGVSMDSVLNNVDMQAGMDIANINQAEGYDQINNRYTGQSNLNSIQQPDYIGTALNTGLSIYRDPMVQKSIGKP